MNKKLLVLFIVLMSMAAGVSAAAVTCPGGGAYGYGVGSVVFNSPQYTNVCARFSWALSSANSSDFLHYVVHTSRDATDINMAGTTLDICTVDDTDTVTITVVPVDNNAAGYFCGATDANGAFEQTYTPPTIANAGKLLVYTIFAVLAAIIGIIILIVVIAFILARFGIVNMFKK